MRQDLIDEEEYALIKNLKDREHHNHHHHHQHYTMNIITTTTITSEQTHSWHHMIIFPHFVDCISSWCSSEIVTFSVVGWSPSRCSRFSMRRRSSSTETPSNGTAGSRWMWKTQALWMHSLKAQKVWSEIRRHPGQVWWIMTTWWYS